MMVEVIFTLLEILYSIIVLFKLHVIIIPMIFCGMIHANNMIIGIVFSLSFIVWVYVIIKTVINFLRS